MEAIGPNCGCDIQASADARSCPEEQTSGRRKACGPLPATRVEPKAVPEATTSPAVRENRPAMEERRPEEIRRGSRNPNRCQGPSRRCDRAESANERSDAWRACRRPSRWRRREKAGAALDTRSALRRVLPAGTAPLNSPLAGDQTWNQVMAAMVNSTMESLV